MPFQMSPPRSLQWCRMQPACCTLVVSGAIDRDIPAPEVSASRWRRANIVNQGCTRGGVRCSVSRTSTTHNITEHAVPLASQLRALTSSHAQRRQLSPPRDNSRTGVFGEQPHSSQIRTLWPEKNR